MTILQMVMNTQQHFANCETLLQERNIFHQLPQKAHPEKNIYCELEIFVLKHSLHSGKCLIVWSFCFQKQIWATTSTLLALRIKAYKNISLGEVKY